MALTLVTRVQVSPPGTATTASSVTVTFGTLPVVGNGLVVCVSTRGVAPTTCADTRGHVYAAMTTAVSGTALAKIFYLPRVATSSAPFTITVSAAAPTDWHAVAIEVGQLGIGGLAFDGLARGWGTTSTPITDTLSPLTGVQSFQVAMLACSAAQSSITVGSASPSWTVEEARLTLTPIAGDTLTRVVPSSVGTTPMVDWTITTTGSDWAACLIAFKSDPRSDAIANDGEADAVSLHPLPQSFTQDANDSGTTFPLWYTYTAQPGDNMIGVHFYGDATYIAQTFVYSPAYPTLYLVNANATLNQPLQLPVTPGDTYTFRIVSNTGTVGTALLHVEAEAFADQPVPAGSFAINDDKTGFPLDLLSRTTALPLQYIQGVVAGPTGTTLPNGHLLLYGYRADDVGTARLAFYTPQFVEITSVLWGDFAAIGSNRADTFYVGMTADPAHDWTATITSFSPLGVLGQTWVLPEGGMRTLEVANDDSVAYFTQDAPGPIKRWDLVADSALSDLAAADGTGHSVIDLLILGDDTVVALFQVPTMGDTVVKRFSPSGTLLNTYPFGDLWEPRIASALDDPATFWFYQKLLQAPGVPSGEAFFLNVRVSDGVVLSTVGPTYLFPQGTYRGDDALTPPARFGIATSCPFWITRVPISGPPPIEPPEPPIAPGYHLEARYIRRLRRAPHVNNENLRVFYRRFELDLERGQALASGQGSEPYVLLRISRDGGQTWGEEQRMAAGQLGEYQARVLARRLGHGRDVVFEVVVSDPVAWSLVGAFLDLEPGAH